MKTYGIGGEQNRLENIRSVIKSFGIYPTEIEVITNRLYRITDQRNYHYALKKSSLTKSSISNWEKVFHLANKEQLSSVLPVYLTHDGKLYEEVDGNIYYLAPWLSKTNESPDPQKLYRVLGHIHGSTKHTQIVTSNKITKSFKQYKENCKSSREEIMRYVEQFEQNRYMSPFELLVCTQFHVMERVFISIEQLLDDTLTEMEDEFMWSVSLCHGNLSVDHLIQSNQIYLLNWEQVSYDNAILDLNQFFKEKVVHYDEDTRSLIEHFTHYREENTLEQNELKLLAIYLLDPTSYMEIIRDYVKPSNQSMIKHIKNLQKIYRQLMFGLEFSDYVVSEYESISLDELES